MNEPSARSGYDISEVAGAKVPGVSVVVPAYNAVATLGECLKAITDSAYPDLEVLVVDDGSDDGSVLVAEEYSCRSITSEKNIGAAAVRNLGVSEATNSILVFIDSDVVVKKDSISKLISVLVSDMNLAGVSGVYSLIPLAAIRTRDKFVPFCSKVKISKIIPLFPRSKLP